MNLKIFASRNDWRKWLARRHDKDKGIQVVFFKKGSSRRTFVYEEAVEEAICYGWIDGVLRRIDDEKYAQVFTPRKKKSGWSELNLKRARRMIDSGKMTRAGLEKLGDALEKYEAEGISKRPPRPEEAPPQLMELLSADPAAWKNFQKLAPSRKRLYLGWVVSAKKDEIRLRRMKEVVKVLSQGKKLGMK